MSNEPVAWIRKDNLARIKCCADIVRLQKRKIDDDFVPIYTHPVKELTDEEIDNLIMEVAEKPTDEDLLDFARAILRKAQAK